MSTNSIISLPPQLELISRSIPLLKRKNPENWENDGGGGSAIHQQNNFVDVANSSSVSVSSSSSSPPPINYNFLRECQAGTLVKLSETSFPIALKENQPVNLQIMLHAANQMSSARARKVNVICLVDVILL